jgi:hypothetical protein
MKLESLTIILVLAAITEGLVEYLIRPLVKPWRRAEAPAPVGPSTAVGTKVGEAAPSIVEGPHDLILRYAACLVGVALCVLYDADLLGLLGLTPPWPWVGPIITGLLIGRGSNWLHDFAGRWLAPGS